MQLKEISSTNYPNLRISHTTKNYIKLPNKY